LFHPISFSVVLPLYRLIIGKIILVVLQKLGLISKVYEKGEKRGVRPGNHPAKFPNALSILALSQLERLDLFNTHRKKLAHLYFEKLKNNSDFELQKFDENSVYLMYTLLSERAREIRKNMKAEGVILGAWWGKGIVPSDADLQSVQYELGICPMAEELGMKAVNLPTNINVSPSEAKKIADLLADGR
jgi:dTDP-4-amino-4,6-dideoxygalactose transaminase